MALAAGPVKRPSSRPTVQPLVAQQLGEEAPVLDAQVGPVDVVLGQPGEPRRRVVTASARSVGVSRSPRDSTHG